MNVLFAAAECAPFVKVGGLGDVAGEMPGALSRLGHSVRVVLPHHGAIADKHFGITPYHTFEMSWNESIVRAEVSSVTRQGVTYFFIRGWPFFAPEETFIYSQDEGIDVGRFLFFSAATLELVRWLAREEGWQADVIHANDWHTAMLPYLVHHADSDDPVLGRMPTLFSIHNLRYQGWGAGWHLDRAGLPPVSHGLLQSMGRLDNSLAIGLAFSTMLSTVSPRYAWEITSQDGGFGLDGLLHARQSRLVGVLNGIDTQHWNPSDSARLTQLYDVDTLDKRTANKLALQAELGLPQRADVPLVGAVMRLVEQKGPTILVPAMHNLLDNADVQFVLLGSGQYEYETSAYWLGQTFKDKAAVRLAFDAGLAERIYGGCDMFVMPSMFEPCGIGQMIAMRYGALPVVRAVGGLIDTVSPNVGFLFDAYDYGALEHALWQAINVYVRRPEAWRTRQQAAMRIDNSWEKSAQRYVALYRQTSAVRQKYR